MTCKGMSEAYSGILTIVPPYAAECRSVCVIRVLDASRSWLVLLLCCPQEARSTAAGRHPSPAAASCW